MVEQPLVVGDHEDGAVRRAQRVDAVGDELHRVDVEAGVGLVEDAHPRLEHRHLQDLVALLLAAREADVERPLQHLGVDVERLAFARTSFRNSAAFSSASPRAFAAR